jgi:hypothetical protein
LIVTLGSAAPSFATPWSGPSLHGGESAGSASGTDSAHEVKHHLDSSGHAEHEGSHPTSADESHDSHDAGAGADDAHGSDASAHDDHDAAGSDASAGADDGHDGHDDNSSEHGDAGPGGERDTVSDATKTRVLGGFGVVNAAAVGGAVLLRRRDRKDATKQLRNRADQSDRRADRDRTRRTR